MQMHSKYYSDSLAYNNNEPNSSGLLLLHKRMRAPRSPGTPGLENEAILGRSALRCERWRGGGGGALPWLKWARLAGCARAAQRRRRVRHPAAERAANALAGGCARPTPALCAERCHRLLPPLASQPRFIWCVRSNDGAHLAAPSHSEAVLFPEGVSLSRHPCHPLPLSGDFLRKAPRCIVPERLVSIRGVPDNNSSLLRALHTLKEVEKILKKPPHVQ